MHEDMTRSLQSGADYGAAPRIEAPYTGLLGMLYFHRVIRMSTAVFAQIKAPNLPPEHEDESPSDIQEDYCQFISIESIARLPLNEVSRALKHPKRWSFIAHHLP